MLAVAIETKADYCQECKRYRYLNHQIDSNKLVCDRCLQILKYNNVIEFVKPKPKAVVIAKEKVKKSPKKRVDTAASLAAKEARILRLEQEMLIILTSEPIALTAKQMQERLLLSKWWTWRISRNLIDKNLVRSIKRGRDIHYYHIRHQNNLIWARDALSEKVIDFLNATPRCFTSSEIKECIGAHHKTVLSVLSKLIEQNFVVCSRKSRNKVYAHVKHRLDLRVFDNLEIGYPENIKQVKSILDSTPDIISAPEIYELFKRRKAEKCILGCLRFIAARGDARSYRIDEGKFTEFFASTNNEIAIQKLEEAIKNNLGNRILAAIASGVQRKADIAEAVERSLQVTGRVLKRLEQEGKITRTRIVTRAGAGYRYELAK